MGNINSFREIMERARIVHAKIRNGTAELEFDISGADDGRALLYYLGDEWLIRQLTVSDAQSDNTEEPGDSLDEDFETFDDGSLSDALTVAGCHCSLSVNIRSGEIIGSAAITGTYEGEPLTAGPVRFDNNNTYLNPEDAEFLLFLAEQHSVPEKSPSDHYAEEIRNLFFCDSVRGHVRSLVDSFLTALKDKETNRKFSVMPIPFAVCPISPLDEIPMGETSLKYVHTKISPENYGKFDKIYSSLMRDPELHYNRYAGNKDFCLTRGNGDLPELLFSAVTVDSTKPCACKTTETLDFMVRLLKQEFGKHGIAVSDPALFAKETYKLKHAEKSESCRRGFTDLRCSGCSHRTGFFSKYSDCICSHGIYLNLSKK